MSGEVRPATRKSPPLFGITCIHCGAEMTGEFIDELIQRWNARAAATASMDKDGATVVDMVADWLEENGYDGMTDGRCSCTGGCLMHCGLVRSRRCSAAHLFPCTRCTHLTTCDRTTGADVYSTDADWCGEFEEA